MCDGLETKGEMTGQDPRSPQVEVYMMEEEALWAEWDKANSEQGSSTE